MARKRKKKTKRQKLKDTLEKLVKDFVRDRDNYTCQKCSRQVYGTNCHASHVIPVSRDLRLAFDPLNLKVLCFHDHINWWHKNPVESGDWFTRTFPERWEYIQDRLRRNATLGTIPLEWFEQRIDELRVKPAEYKRRTGLRSRRRNYDTEIKPRRSDL